MGDLIHGEGLDRLEPDFTALQRLLQPLRCPFYPVVGNHEVVQQERSATHLQPYRAAFGENRSEYTFTHGGILFVALNNSGAPSAEAARQRNEWLRDALSAGRGQPKIILCHIPLIPLRDEPTLATSFGFSSYCDRDPGTLNLVEEHRDTVIAVLSGHLHLTGVKHQREICHISIAGTASYPSDIALYEVFPDRIEVTVKQLPEDLAKVGNQHPRYAASQPRFHRRRPSLGRGLSSRPRRRTVFYDPVIGRQASAREAIGAYQPSSIVPQVCRHQRVCSAFPSLLINTHCVFVAND